MNIFDLHCDTITACYDRRLSLQHNGELHLSLERGSRYDPWVQCFAVWIPDTLRGQAAVDYFTAVAAFLEATAAKTEQMILCTKKEDLNKTGPVCHGLLTVEGGAVLAGDLSNIEHLHRHHVRALTLTWNGSCEIGDGAMVAHPRGLTPFGKQVIPALEEADILVDVSHASEPLFYDVASLAQKPIIATHSNARAICDHPRNLTDEQFLEIKRCGGLVGLNLHRWFLREDGEATLDDVFCHVAHFLSLGGEKTLALGTDFDGAELGKVLRGIEDLERLADDFSRRGLSDGLIHQIFYQNAKDFFDSL
ncbi:MAG: membrane dipeptidase [Oscillospiraceae bacterium]|nr:membrane dipeptidase [Oscillospiraceae bacterium]